MDSLQTISNDLVQSINEKEKKKSTPYDTYAKVIRIDGGTAWVHIPGGVDETPVVLTVNAKVGDSVLVRVSGGNAWIVGNSSAPPTDDTKAEEAKGVADVAQVKAASAQETAESAEEIAKDASRTVKSTSQYFWHTETDTGAGAGAHITEVPQEEFLDDPANGGGNLLAQSGGIAIRDGLTTLAEFGASGVIIGQSNTGQCIIVEPTAVTFIDNGLIYAKISYNAGTVIKDIRSNQKLEIGASGITLLNDRGEGLTVSGYSVSATGDISAAGTITSGNHATPIGHTTARKTGTYSLATGTTFVTVPESDLPRITLSEGTWIIHAHAAFESNNTGRRSMRIYDTTTSEGLSRSFINQTATNGAATNMQTMAIVSLEESNTFTLQLAQNSGAAKSVDLVLEAVRIA